jgi:hypothetical protein
LYKCNRSAGYRKRSTNSNRNARRYYGLLLRCKSSDWLSRCVGPFTYALDGNAAISSASTTFSFANVTPGTHTILVTDSNNCTSTIPNIVIAPAVATYFIARLDLFSRCLYWEPSNYGWLWNSIYLYGFVQCRNCNSSGFIPIPLPGTYVFTVTDSRGCPATKYDHCNSKQHQRILQNRYYM